MLSVGQVQTHTARALQVYVTARRLIPNLRGTLMLQDGCTVEIGNIPCDDVDDFLKAEIGRKKLLHPPIPYHRHPSLARSTSGLLVVPT